MADPRSNSSVATIGTTMIMVSEEKKASARRIVFTLQNVSTGGQVISVAFGQNPIAGQGIVLNPGGFYGEVQDAAFATTQERIMAISTLAGGLLAVTERVM